MVLSVCGLMGLHLMGAVDAYIPEPQPMRGDIEVTALYYPGTEHMPEWDMVKQVTPEVKPLLGWYDEPIIGNLHAVDFEKMVAAAKVVPDGDWHEYAIALDKVRGWWGSVNELWFEAVNVRAANVEIDWMRFE